MDDRGVADQALNMRRLNYNDKKHECFLSLPQTLHYVF